MPIRQGGSSFNQRCVLGDISEVQLRRVKPASTTVRHLPRHLTRRTQVPTGSVPGNALDKSGLRGKICSASLPENCVPQAIYGGFGSALAYTGHDNVFVAAPDRGPLNGLTDVPYLDRVNFIHMTVDPAAPFPNIKTTLLDTRLLKNSSGQFFRWRRRSL